MAEAEAPTSSFLPRWAFYALVPGLVGPLLVLGFIFVSERAHDEARCPYRRVSVREVAPGVHVREDGRNCLADVIERRYTVVRDGGERVLGRRRLRAAAFDPQGYRWQPVLLEGGIVSVRVHNPGHDDASFREGRPGE